MSRPIFKIIGGVIIASAVLFFISFLILKIALVFLVIKGFMSLFRRQKFIRGFNRNNPTHLYDFKAPDYFHDFNGLESVRTNAKVIVIS